jgi:hypothetical protein
MNKRLIFYPIFFLVIGAGVFFLRQSEMVPRYFHAQEMQQITEQKPSEEREFMELRKSFLTGDYQTVERALNAALQTKRITKAGRNYDAVVFSRLFDDVAITPELLTTIDRWIKDYPTSPFGYIAKAQYLHDAAWEIRGNSYSSLTPNERMAAFAEKTNEATTAANKSVEINPSVPYAYFLLSSLAGQVHGKNNLYMMEDILARAEKAGITNINNIHSNIQYYGHAAEWGGSNEEVLEYAHTVSKNADAQSLLPLLIPAAYETIAPSNSYAEKKAFLSQPAVWDEISKSYQHVIKAYPDTAEWYSKYAEVAWRAGKLDIFTEMVNRAYYADPYYYPNYQLAVDVYQRGGQYDVALKYADEYLAIKQDSYEMYGLLAKIKIDQKEYEKAIEYATKSIDLYPNTCASWTRRCLAKHRLGQNEEALKDCNQAIAYRPACDFAYRTRSEVYQALGLTEEGLKDVSTSDKIKTIRQR